MDRFFFYLHTNGDLIGKNSVVVDTDPKYFDSPFVKKVWEVDLDKREDGWKLILEALAFGANISPVKELAKRWELTFEDSKELLKRVELIDTMKKGLDRFVKEILEMSFEEYISKIKQGLDKRLESKFRNRI